MIFKKKRKEVEIPEAPRYTFPEVKEMKEAIKPEETELPELPELPEMPKLPEKMMEDGISREEKEEIVKKLPANLIQEIGERPKLKTKLEKAKKVRLEGKEIEMPKIRRALFIKIDKFKEILSSVDEIEKKIQEISNVIKKLKEIRNKEDTEMARWESEINEIKTRLEAIEKNLSKIET